MANPFDRFDKTLKEREGEADIVQSGASATSSLASAESASATAAEKRATLPSTVTKEKALAQKAVSEAEQARIALDKVKALSADLPPVKNLAEAQNAVLMELRALAEAKRLSQTGAFATGFGSATASGFSGSPAASVDALLKPVQANAAFSALQKMRQESPTGGALGSVTERELELLFSKEGVIDPRASDKVFQQGVDGLIANRINVLNKLNAAPETVAEALGPDNIEQFAPKISAYRFRQEDEKALARYVEQNKKGGTFDPTEYASMMAAAYYNATGRKPDEKFVVDAVKTGRQILEMKDTRAPAFDYSPADEAARGYFTAVGKTAQGDGLSFGEALGEGALNLIPSTFDLAVNTVKALTVNLPETIEGAAQIIAGATGLSDDKTAVNALVDYYKSRYGSAEGFKKALAEDPASLLADVAGVATLGAGTVAGGANLAAKIGNLPRLAKAARAVEGFGEKAAILDPLVASAKLTKTGAQAAGAVGKAVGVSAPARMAGRTVGDVEQSFDAGRRGSPQFLEQMRGEGDVIDPVAKAQAALSELYKQRGADYIRRMTRLNRSPETLDFKDVQAAIDDVRNVGRHKGIDISSAADVWDEVDTKVAEFSQQGLNTIEDFDAMKRAVGNIRDKYQRGTPQYKVAQEVANSINRVITEKAPVYANIMGDYRVASDTLSDVQNSLSLGAKSADTALNKLRRIAQGKGPRGRTVLDLLEGTQAGKGLGDILAGQAMSGREPGGLTPSLSGAAAMAAGSPEPLAATLVSPRRLGEVAYGAGSLLGRGERALGAVPGASGIRDAAASLFERYAEPTARGVRIANPPLIQPQVSEYEYAPPVQDAELARLIREYRAGPPRLSAEASELERLLERYRQAEQEPEQFAAGGMVMAPRTY
jgi:hypothetical protein